MKRMKLLEDIILEDNGQIRIVSSGSKIISEADILDLDKEAGQELDIGDEIPDIFDLDTDVISKENAAKVTDQVKQVASKVNALKDEDVKNAANTVLNAFIRVFSNDKKLGTLKDFIQKIASKIQGFQGDQNHPGYLGIKLVWKPLSHIVDQLDTMTEDVELKSNIKNIKEFIAESKINWRTGSIIA